MSLVYRFYNTDNSAHFFTSSKQEKYNILDTLPQLRYEGIAWTTEDSGDAALNFRFYNTTSGAHFYTASVAERNYVTATFPHLQYEGGGFNVSRDSLAPNDQAVFRFYRYDTDSHFYTISSSERDEIIARFSQFYQYDGVGWYADRPPNAAELAADQAERAAAYSYDEAWYLAAYSDVADAVAAGTTTGAAHYAAFGRAEGRSGAARAELAGNDTITSGNSLTRDDAINGGAGDDSLSGNVTNIFGETGNDTLSGGTNLNGGSGDDTYIIHSSAQTVTEGSAGGTDHVVFRANGVDPITADLGDFANVEGFTLAAVISSSGDRMYSITGTAGADVVTAENTQIVADTSYVIDLGGGNDTLTAGGSGTITLGDGVDSVRVDAGSAGMSGFVVADLKITDFAPEQGERITFQNSGGKTFTSTSYDTIGQGGTIDFTASTGEKYSFQFDNYSAAQISLDWFIL